MSFLLPAQNRQPFLLVGFDVMGRLAFAQHDIHSIGLIFSHSDFGLLGGLEMGLVQIRYALVFDGLVIEAFVHLVDGRQIVAS